MWGFLPFFICLFVFIWLGFFNIGGVAGDFYRNKEADSFLELIACIHFVLSKTVNYLGSATILE